MGGGEKMGDSKAYLVGSAAGKMAYAVHLAVDPKGFHKMMHTDKALPHNGVQARWQSFMLTMSSAQSLAAACAGKDQAVDTCRSARRAALFAEGAGWITAGAMAATFVAQKKLTKGPGTACAVSNSCLGGLFIAKAIAMGK